MHKAEVFFLAIFYMTVSVGQISDIEKTIRALDYKNAYFVVKADTTGLMDLLDQNFTINRTTGQVVSGRGKILELMRQGIVSYDSFSVNTEFVLVKTPTLAVSVGSPFLVRSLVDFSHDLIKAIGRSEAKA